MILISFFFGIIGLVIGLIIFIVYLATLKSFKMPYFSPLIPLNIKNLIKQFIRLPYRSEKRVSQDENGN
jgi:spore germination protein KA